MELQLKKEFPQLTQEQINVIQTEMKLDIPKDLIQFYMIYNGGEPNKKFFYCDEIESYVKVKSFIPFSCDKKDEWSIPKTYNKFCINNKFINCNYLPFAWDEGDNLYCINICNNSIYLIYLDIGIISEDEYIFLAPNFTSFISELQIDEIYDEDEE